jgi:hypothetical protein
MSAAKRWVEERHGIENPVCQVSNKLFFITSIVIKSN